MFGLTNLDLLSLGWFMLAWAIHAYVVERSNWRKKSLNYRMDLSRRDWMRAMLGREVRIDAAFPNGWLMGTGVRGTPPEYGGAGPAPSWNITTIRYGLNERDYTLPGVSNNRGPNNPLLSPHGEGVNVVFGDGSVHLLSSEYDVLALKRSATRDDGASRVND